MPDARALGFEMRNEEGLLRDFVLFIEAGGEDGCIRAQTALNWACSSADGLAVALREVAQQADRGQQALVEMQREE